MLIAKLIRRESPDGKQYLSGTIIGEWTYPPGTPVILRRCGDTYELLELAPREPRFSPAAIESFCGTDEPPTLAPDATSSP